MALWNELIWNIFANTYGIDWEMQTVLEIVQIGLLLQFNSFLHLWLKND